MSLYPSMVFSIDSAGILSENSIPSNFAIPAMISSFSLMTDCISELRSLETMRLKVSFFIFWFSALRTLSEEIMLMISSNCCSVFFLDTLACSKPPSTKNPDFSTFAKSANLEESSSVIKGMKGCNNSRML